MAVFYDTHAHVGFPDFSADLPAVVERAAAAGIEKIIVIGTDQESSARAVSLAEQFPQVYAAVGWHPTHVGDAPPDVRPGLRALANHPKVVAIGETGLDYHRRGRATETEEQFARYKERQAEIFHQQLDLAAELRLNCIIHQRDSFVDTIAQLRPWAGKTRGVFHCFSEPLPALQEVLDLGALVSYTGIITFKNGQNARDALAATPMGRFMLETDCPFLAPVPFRGKRCEPAYVREIAAQAAEVKKCSLEELSAATTAIAHAFFPKLTPRQS
jgi:TatD DNase family protein